jgi:hypothetical protein
MINDLPQCVRCRAAHPPCRHYRESALTALCRHCCAQARTGEGGWAYMTAVTADCRGSQLEMVTMNDNTQHGTLGLRKI